jgi:hypothetical protein
MAWGAPGAVYDSANESQSESGFHSANESQSESGFHSANESQSESDAEALASVESNSKAKGASIEAMSGAAARYLHLRRSHPQDRRELERPKVHEALHLGPDENIRFRWI